MQEHLKIIAALRTRDPARAAAAIGDHITAARNRALGLPAPDAREPPARSDAVTTIKRASARVNRGGTR
jgi:hypothetical protein